MKPTIKDVAKKAKVSVATVSRVLNGRQGYTVETKQKVLRVIDEIGYRPNAIARGLVKKSTRTLGVLLPSLTSGFMSELLNGIVSTAHEMGYSAIICPTGERGKDTLEYLQILNEQQVGGIILACERPKEEYIQEFSRIHIPVVLVSTYAEHHQIPYIRVDDVQAAYQATKYLIERGHKQIGLICGWLRQDDPIAAIPRFKGYKQALKDFDVPFREENVAYGDFHYKSGIRCTESLLKESPDITAIFAISDEMAVGVLSYAYQQGIKVPDELSVIGYDDTQIAEMAIPPLTTVHQPIYEMGEQAVNMLLKDNGTGGSIIMPYRIVERDTVKSIT
jgi:LacI family transcriptional regulator